METRYEEASKVTILAILWNVFLSVIKIFAGVIGNSTAMIADGTTFCIRYYNFSMGVLNRK